MTKLPLFSFYYKTDANSSPKNNILQNKGWIARHALYYYTLLYFFTSPATVVATLTGDSHCTMILPSSLPPPATIAATLTGDSHCKMILTYSLTPPATITATPASLNSCKSFSAASPSVISTSRLSRPQTVITESIPIFSTGYSP